MKAIALLVALAAACTLVLTACSFREASMDASLESPPAVSSKNNSDGTGSETEAYHKITAQEAKERMDKGGVTIVDVRTAEEYAQKHIPGAVLVPVESIGNEPIEALPDKDAVILVHCRTGIRSKQASERLVGMGYTNIYDFGGIVDWPYETQSGEAD